MFCKVWFPNDLFETFPDLAKNVTSLLQRMASKVCRGFLRPLKGRLMGTQAAAAARKDTRETGMLLPYYDPMITKLPNGLLVASLENFAPISRIAVVVNAGSRFETGDNLGVTHMLRVFAGMGTKDSTAFGLTRTMQQSGANYTCSANREFMTYQVDCIRDELDGLIPLINNVINKPAFKPWEVSDLQKQLALDRALFQSQYPVCVSELLHEAAFRTTLGISVCAPQHMIGHYTPEMLEEYVQNFYTVDRMAIVGVGVDHDHLVGLCSSFKPNPSSGISTQKAKYAGGEIRVNNGNGLVTAALATEGPCLPSKDLLPACILQMAMGTGPFIKYSNNTEVSRLGKAAASVTSSPFGISCISGAYSDGGIFGFSATTNKDDIGKVLKAAFQEFAQITKIGIKPEEINRAKNQLKAAVLMQAEHTDMILEDMGQQLLMAGGLADVDAFIDQIDMITAEDVNLVAKKIINGKPSMAAIGDLSKTPYLDELYK